MADTLTSSCSATYWGNSTGIKICTTYKALFAFTVLAALGHFVAVVIDIVARRRQNRSGRYGRMAADFKADDHSENFLLSDRDLYNRLSPQSDLHGHESGHAADLPPPPVHNNPVSPVSHYDTVDLAEREHGGEAAQYYGDAEPPAASRRRGHSYTDTDGSELFTGSEYPHSPSRFNDGGIPRGHGRSDMDSSELFLDSGYSHSGHSGYGHSGYDHSGYDHSGYDNSGYGHSGYGHSEYGPEETRLVPGYGRY